MSFSECVPETSFGILHEEAIGVESFSNLVTVALCSDWKTPTRRRLDAPSASGAYLWNGLCETCIEGSICEGSSADPQRGGRDSLERRCLVLGDRALNRFVCFLLETAAKRGLAVYFSRAFV